MTRPAVCVRVCRPLRFCVSSSDQCVTGDGEPCSHLSPVRQQRRSTIHPHLARQRAGLQGCVKHKHTHTHRADSHIDAGQSDCVPVFSLSQAADLTLCVCKSESQTKYWHVAHMHTYDEMKYNK